jgi:hypothetical protein
MPERAAVAGGLGGTMNCMTNDLLQQIRVELAESSSSVSTLLHDFALFRAMIRRAPMDEIGRLRASLNQEQKILSALSADPEVDSDRVQSALRENEAMMDEVLTAHDALVKLARLADDHSRKLVKLSR